MKKDWLDEIKWTDDGLVSAIAQDAESGRVLMFAWMNRESLGLTEDERGVRLTRILPHGSLSGKLEEGDVILEVGVGANDREAFRLIHEDAGFIPLHQRTLAWAMSDRLDASVRAATLIASSAMAAAWGSGHLSTSHCLRVRAARPIGRPSRGLSFPSSTSSIRIGCW